MTAGSSGLFGGIFARGDAAAAVSDDAWIAAMLEVEGALALACGDAGLVPRADAETIASVCGTLSIDPVALGEESRATANPVVPLVRHLTAAVPAQAAGHVHRGATSQDILDTAAMLVARRAIDAVLADLAPAADAAARLAEAHRETVMAGRTLLQQAVPVTFGLVAAGWLAVLDDARVELAAVRTSELTAQLGGAAGTLASLGDRGTAVAAAFAKRLGLAEPSVPWHTARRRPARLASALGETAGAIGSIALDLVLLAQTEVAEVAEGGSGQGGSSTMPHKRNAVAAVSALACARRTPGLVATMLAAMPQELQRAAGGWQAEWETLSELARLTGSAGVWIREALTGLAVDPERMRDNLELTQGLVMAEAVTTSLTGSLGRGAAHELVERACRQAAEEGRTLADVLAGTAEVPEPASYLGAAGELVDRALAAHLALGKEASL
jgi:3-carboxy-cis,cis-muconate cycloisomerase